MNIILWIGTILFTLSTSLLLVGMDGANYPIFKRAKYWFYIWIMGSVLVIIGFMT